MSRNHSRIHTAFTVTLVAVIVLAFLPARWLGWTSDLARIISVPLMPFRDLGTSLAGWLTPHGEARMRAFDGEQHLLQHYEELDRMYVASQLRIAELEEQLLQIQQIPLTELDVPTRLLSARVTARNPRSRTASVEINRGSRHGVTTGTIAVFAGVHLIGKVSQAGTVSSTLLPMTNADHGPLRAVVVSPDELVHTGAIRQITVEPQGDGTFLAEPHADIAVSRGDIVRLASMPDWPRSSMGMVLGVVESVSNEQSLRKRVIIQPRHEAAHVPNVVLKIELDEQEDRRQ